MTDVAVADALDELDQILGDGAIRSVYQPVVDLGTSTVVAYEALARGPEGSRLERPDHLFAAARRAGRLTELDWACRVAALEGALEAGLGRSASLFVNVEPGALGQPPSAAILDLLRTAGENLRVVVEVTERSLVTAPAELLAALQFVRDLGWGVALDDVGAEIASLALMPFVAPDVIKLDLRLVQQRPSREIAMVVGAVDAQAERSGATVLAEGIETEAHLQTALGMGARLGQGWLFARPGPLPATGLADAGRAPSSFVPLPAPPAPVRSPMTAARRGREVRRSTKPLLLAMSRHLEGQALAQGSSVVVLSAFQLAERFTPATAARYVELAQRAAFVGALGVDMPESPAPGVRGGVLADDDPLVDEWAIAVIGPHFSATLAAIDLGDDGPDDERRFDYVLSYDRDVTMGVARSLMTRIAADD
jgi:EAL domain-containing protein (putative c-di-GMP-specific phosphodiesterase class I)